MRSQGCFCKYFSGIKHNLQALPELSVNPYLLLISAGVIPTLLQGAEGSASHFYVYGLEYGFPSACFYGSRINMYRESS